MAKFMPAREQAKPIRIIHDLDIIDSEKIGIKWKDKEYPIESISVGQSMQITLAYQKVIDIEMKLSQGEKVEKNDVALAYYNLLSILIPDITPSDILEMGQHRVNLILSLIARVISGDPSLNEEVKKKVIQNQSMKLGSSFFHKLLSSVPFINSAIKKS